MLLVMADRQGARMSIRPGITTLLGLAARGDRQAQDQLFRLIETELRRRAKVCLRQEHSPHALQTTLLVDEAFVRLVGGQHVAWENRSQFYCCAAKVMRQLLVDDARQRAAAKRGGGALATSLERSPDPADRSLLDPLTLLQLHEALNRLGESYPELIQIVELHHFGGWDLKEIAENILGVPYTTVKRRWQRAKALLHRDMSGASDET
jgi:RNA polymerase sigma factor (TIGR02999 family)